MESELFVGPALTSIGGVVHAGIGIGGGGTYTLTPTSLGPLEVRLAVMPVFGTDLQNVFTMTQVHVPLTLALSFRELPRDRRGRGIGGSVGLGLTATGGQVHERVVLQPSAMVELVFGAFTRGALVVRYQTTITDIATSKGPVGYNSLVIIASTAW